jgi:hypothetical protein
MRVVLIAIENAKTLALAGSFRHLCFEIVVNKGGQISSAPRWLIRTAA